MSTLKLNNVGQFDQQVNELTIQEQATVCGSEADPKASLWAVSGLISGGLACSAGGPVASMACAAAVSKGAVYFYEQSK